MKSFKIFFIAIIAIATFQTTKAQSNKSERNVGLKTENVKVYGNCGMDKNRIEKNASLTDGVKSAIWNEHTQVLTVTYSVFKNHVIDNVQKRIASAGNDTERYRADDAVYQNLPECCHYQRKKS